ncbi:phage tail assembly protein [Glaciimonas sp. Gout2]|uniref:phage tail assembly protein n=1 Tax=unclassified Glaciimonas TaxID=2644401 RepID=UPI002B233420|nr:MULTISPECIES: phage tail assembly protein [unclassified Glaciimonas]MEB0012580.1 phage tail assembly protein [Glaciimonas sp. Cout2]MEB0083931.1 phage tail assembly protein [Glaciimonas sp. Gout2]
MSAVKTSVAPSTNHVTVILDEPLQRGDTVITAIQLRKPKAGELRGVSLVDVANLDVMALQKVLPRITQPILTTQDVNNLDLADLMALGAEVAYFLAKKADRNMVSPTA